MFKRSHLRRGKGGLFFLGPLGGEGFHHGQGAVDPGASFQVRTALGSPTISWPGGQTNKLGLGPHLHLLCRSTRLMRTEAPVPGPRSEVWGPLLPCALRRVGRAWAGPGARTGQGLGRRGRGRARTAPRSARAARSPSPGLRESRCRGRSNFATPGCGRQVLPSRPARSPEAMGALTGLLAPLLLLCVRPPRCAR